MKRYKVETQKEGSVRYFFIRDMESLEIVLLPSKYLMHQVRANRSPNTIRRNAFALAYYWEYLLENEKQAEDIYEMDYETQYDYFAEYLKWLKAGKHTDNLEKEPQNKTCNAYLKEVFRFYCFLEAVQNNGSYLSVLSYNQPITKANAIGVRRTLRSRSFKGYLKEEERDVRAAEKNEIITILEACTNCRDQVLILLTSELGFRIGEILGIDYTKDIDYETHEIRVNFREDNENDARAKNAEERRGRVSDDTFEFLLYYIGEYWDILQKQEYLFINIKGDTAGKPMKVDSVYDMFERMEKKTGIKVTPHMLRRYYANTRWEADWPLEMISQALGHKHLDTTIRCTRHLNGLKSVYEFCMQEQIEDLRYLTQKQFDKIENYGDTDYKKKCAKQELRACQEYIFCHAKNIAWDSTIWFMERLYLEEYRVNPSSPVKTISFMNIEKKDDRELVQEYMKYCLGITHLALHVIQKEFYKLQSFVIWLEDTTEISLKQVSENEIKEYFQIIDYKEASYFNDIIIAIYQFYEYLQTKNIIKEVPFNYQYYLKKEILHHNDRSVEQETYESILKHLKDFPEKPRLILLHSMLLGLRISEVCCLKGNAYYWQGRDAWIRVYQIKMRTYKRIPIPEILYKIMKVYIKKYGIGAEDYIFQNQKGKAYHYSSFRWSMKKIFNENHELFQEYNFKSHDFRHTIATMFYEDGVPLQSVRDYLGHDYEEMTQQYVDYMPKRISKANQELFAKEGSSLASGIKRCKRGK